MTLTLRDYQLDAIEAGRQELLQGEKRVMFVSPTGSGKTIIFSEITSRAVAKGKNAVILVHRGELLDQTGEKLEALGLRHGIIQACDSTDPDAPIQVCSVDSLRTRSLPIEPDLLIVDECHLASANRYRRIFDQYPAATILSFTATPWRTDGRGFREFANKLIEVASIQQLIDAGHLVPPRWYIGDDPEGLEDVKITSAGDYDLASLECIINTRSIIGGMVDNYRKFADGMKTVVFAVSIAHSKAIVKQFQEVGYRAEHIDGEMKKTDRKAVLARLRSGETQIVVNAAVLCEGWDEPGIECVILGRPTKSLALYIQQCGRGLRPFEGKTECRILDHAGNFLRHGCITDRREYSLDPDFRMMRGEGKRKRERKHTCSWCGFVTKERKPLCPACGLSEPPKIRVVEKDGELRELPNTVEFTVKRKWASLVNEARRRRTRDGRTYMRDWAFYQLMNDYEFESLVKHLGNDVVPRALKRQKGLA